MCASFAHFATIAWQSRFDPFLAWLAKCDCKLYLKKSLGHFQPADVTQRYAAIDQLEEEDLPVALLCETLGVSRSAYYVWRRPAIGQRERDDQRLLPQIRDIFWE